MRVLIIGATGLLGSALLEEWQSGEVIGAYSKDADIRDDAQVRSLLARRKPDWTVLAAAYTDVDGCERNPELAQQINFHGAVNVARAARDSGSRLLFLSTDYVFDGARDVPYETNDPARPIGAYGRSKAAAETAVREIVKDSCIVRTSWLFGTAGRCFPETILRLAETEKELSVVADQIGSPTLNRDLARVIEKLIEAGACGFVHATNSGTCSWYEFAQEILRVAGRNKTRIRPTTTEESARLAPRPHYSVLSPASLQAYGIFMRPWQEAMQAYVEERLRSPKMAEKAGAR